MTTFSHQSPKTNRQSTPAFRGIAIAMVATLMCFVGVGSPVHSRELDCPTGRCPSMQPSINSYDYTWRTDRDIRNADYYSHRDNTRIAPVRYEQPARRSLDYDRVPARDELDRLLQQRLRDDNHGQYDNRRPGDYRMPVIREFNDRRLPATNKFDRPIDEFTPSNSRLDNSRRLPETDRYRTRYENRQLRDLDEVPLRTRDHLSNLLNRRDHDFPRTRDDNRLPIRLDDYRTPREDRYRFPLTNPQFNPQPIDRYSPETPAVQPAEPTAAEKLQQRLSARYGNPVVIRFVQNVNAQQAARLFQEASTLIDGRHFEPTSYDARIRNGLNNLSAAVRNPQFLQAMRIRPNTAQLQSFQSQLNQFGQRTVRTSHEATQLMYQIANWAQQQIGIPATATILEFVYASAESLDQYSTFLPEEPTRRPSAATGLEDNIVGIGVEIKPHDQGVEVVRPLRNGPAERAGLKKGDIIAAINGRPLAGQNLNYAVDLIAGPAGSQLNLSILRNGRAAGTVTITRSKVRVYSVSEVRLEGRDKTVGYIKLDKFAQSSAQEMDEALWKLHREGMQSLILDLRGNPGGLLTTAIEISNKFLPNGTIVSTRGRNPQDQSHETATYTQTWKVPLVVLIDKGSASASEIFAAAIQENRRGIVVGRQSYGKGTVQTHFPLQSVSGNLKLTTAKFYSPTGREMAGTGVRPDIEVRETAYRPDGVASGQDQDVLTAIDVAESDRVREIAATNGRFQPAGQNR